MCLIHEVLTTTTGRGNEESGSVFTYLETDFHIDIICTVEYLRLTLIKRVKVRKLLFWPIHLIRFLAEYCFANIFSSFPPRIQRPCFASLPSVLILKIRNVYRLANHGQHWNGDSSSPRTSSCTVFAESGLSVRSKRFRVALWAFLSFTARKSVFSEKPHGNARFVV